MIQDNKILHRVYDATRSGLDIITDLLPAIDDAVINKKKAFRLRSDERTPSAYLYPPKDGDSCWHVKDYGMGEGNGFFSPIDLYMWDRGYQQEQFRMAVEELAERYGVQEQLSASANRPDLEQREARADELGAPPRIKLRESLEGLDLSCWGDGIKAEHLETYGWHGVVELAITYGSKVTIRRPTPSYPIFAQKCDYVDQQGLEQTFYKVYEPKNYDKAHRFLIVGRKPQNYIYGLSAVRRMFNDGGEVKLPVLLLVSGGSDAVTALSKGYLGVWLDSEVKGLTASDYTTLQKYCKRLVNIPDIDPTGIKAGTRLALSIPNIYTSWMTEEDMGGLHDNRGRRCKDLRDYCRLHPAKKDMDRLVRRAISARFWWENKDQDGHVEYSIRRTSLDYFLELNGFFTLQDETRQETVYIRVEGVKVSRTTASRAILFLKRWMEKQGLPQDLQDKVLRSRDLPSKNVCTLRERADLDFCKATSTSQRFYFRNRIVDVTAEGISRTPYNAADGTKHVWEKSIIEHSYTEMKPQFSASKGKDERYHIVVAEDAPSKFFRFVRNASRLHWRKVDEQGQALTDEEAAQEEQSLVSKLCNIGYLLHGFKSESMAWATILQDSTLSESEEDCNGRSGKSFYLKALSALLNTFPIEARARHITENRFLFDGVTADTDLIIVDECNRNLDFDFFFGKITGPFRGEEKGNHPFLIPFAQSPRFAFGTNYVLKKHDPSTEGRIWPLVFSDYYHVMTNKNDYRETRSIRDDFGEELMGTDYSEADWQADLSFMLDCLRFYLSLPKSDRKQLPPLHQVERRELMASMGKDFKEWADDYFSADSGNLDREIRQSEVLACYNAEASYQLKMGSFTRKLKDYCLLSNHIHCLNPVEITGQKKDGDRWNRREGGKLVPYYYVQSAKALTEGMQHPQHELPF